MGYINDKSPIIHITYFPKTVYFVSRCGCFAYVIKNCDPLVLGPELAIDTIPRALC